ncbi:MAG: VapC-like domain ribonuclease toxin [Caulobacteraceae bacterium]|nr:VapC-like domain ribonuclease toxin [Caulobacteraceae bacterium]
MPMSEWIMDSSAILAWIWDEAGAEVVAERFDDSMVCSVNFAEVMTKLIDRGVPVEQALGQLKPFRVEAADYQLGLDAGALRDQTRHRGLSLGDRFCLALARRENLPVLTSDRAWAGLDLGVQVVLIR